MPGDGSGTHRHRRPLHLDHHLVAQRVSGLDALLIAMVMVLIAIGVRNLLPFLPGRRD